MRILSAKPFMLLTRKFSIFEQITACDRTKGAADPSGLDAHQRRRLGMLFKTRSSDLCHSLALVAKKLCSSATVHHTTWLPSLPVVSLH